LETPSDAFKNLNSSHRSIAFQISDRRLYCGEQDLFAFLIDPTGWVEMGDGEAFAPGFFLWNSEVGRRSVGVQTFWFQAVCANHVRRFTIC